MRPRSVSWIAAAIALSLSCHEDPSMGTSPVPAVPTVAPAAFVPQRIVDNNEHVMGTHLAMTAYTTPTIDAARVRAAFDAAAAEMRRIEAVMTTWRPDSELSKINDATGIAPVDVGK